MPSQPINLAATVKLNASGNGSVQLGPGIGQKWTLTSASVMVPGAVLIPECNIYIGGAALPDTFVDGTQTGNQDSTDQVKDIPITAGQKIFAVWTGGDNGASATLSIFGVSETGYRQ